ncbi:MAG TPA: PaaI family thioesterase [Vicinamibacterales bacterium]|nr:PaaI family thioesterase [Vicinamibacterales bacterium]
MEPPAGFVPCNDNAFEGLAGPFYVKRHFDSQGRPIFSLSARIRDDLTGASDRAHGGFILTLLDQAMGLGARDALGDLAFTISLHTDFIGPAHVGRWVTAHAHATSTTSTFAFMTASAESDGHPVATGSGVWRLRRTGGQLPEGRRPSY